jgi:probable DNA metabolism protein
LDSDGYTYDGTFEGLLTCIYEAYYRREDPCFISSSKQYSERTKDTMFSLLENPISVETDIEKSCRVYDAIEKKISAEALETIYHVFLSETDNFEIMALNYVRLGFKAGSDLNKHLQDKRVMDMLKAENKVKYEVLRMHGFLRFQEMQGLYYAPYEPVHNITALVTPHFAERLPDQDFIIHDISRGIASVCSRKEWFVTSLDESDTILSSKCIDGFDYEALWKGYFRWTTINERTNLRNQKRQMPKRYWKHLTEFEHD